jgi:hypothetical protein
VLRERGLDVEAVVERAGLVQAPDHEVLDTAAREGRAVVSSNIKDFRPLAAERVTDGRGHAGLILLPARRSRQLGGHGGASGRDRGGDARPSRWHSLRGALDRPTVGSSLAPMHVHAPISRR